ncbi:hypothetical protein [Sphaerisporangium sp. TRM90804]|uniref:hypothetical protein n=1 Tax=Sphaerisporangium sp. TRM90804 TaxID=3031113 RepID=UPI002447092F|nr:hypothetical protein [Sphaerisporangium sp. TRM90804]MDH2429334.1 hypothetical protein [Sphaerisporangium sp. TRM90804]
MTISIEGGAELVRGIVRQILLDVPGVKPESLELFDGGTARCIVTVPDEQADRAALIAANATQQANAS